MENVPPLSRNSNLLGKYTILFIILAMTGCRDLSPESGKHSNIQNLNEADGTPSTANAARQNYSGTWSNKMPFEEEEYQCPENQEFAFFRFVRSAQISEEDTGLFGSPVIEPVDLKKNGEVAGVDESHILYGIRLDFCLDDDEKFYFVQGIVEKKGYYAFGRRQPTVHHLRLGSSTEPDTQSTSPAFARALLQDDYSQMSLTFDADRDGEPSYFLQGHSDSQGRNFLTVSSYSKGSDPRQIIHSESLKPVIAAGTLTYGDAFPEYDRTTPRTDLYKKARYFLEIANPPLSFEFIYEVNLGIGGYRVYRFDQLASIKIKHNNPGLPRPIDIFEQKTSIDRVMSYQSSHHNLSDRFVFTDRITQTVYSLYKGPAETAVLKISYPTELNIADETHELTRRLMGGIPGPQ